MCKCRLQKSLKSINILIVAMILVVAILFSSCSSAKDYGENQAPVLESTEFAGDQAADNQEKNEKDIADLLGKDESVLDDVDVSDDSIIDTKEDDKDVIVNMPVDAENEVKEFDAVEDMQLGALKADLPKAEVEKVMKSELVNSTSKEEYGMETEILTYKDGTVINLLSGKVYSISVKSPDYATPRGLKVGDTEETLRKLYGEPSAVEEGKWIYSPRGYDMFFVTVENGIIVEIMISQVL